MLLGGRTAEEIALGEISTGAQNDLQRATDIARAMVTEFGMSEAMGAVNYDSHSRNRVPRHPASATSAATTREETAREIDAEVRRIMSRRARSARARCSPSAATTLEQVARRLLEKEVIEGDELREIVEASQADARPAHRCRTEE